MHNDLIRLRLKPMLMLFQDGVTQPGAPQPSAVLMPSPQLTASRHGPEALQLL
jgi:hypothetical protein